MGYRRSGDGRDVAVLTSMGRRTSIRGGRLLRSTKLRQNFRFAAVKNQSIILLTEDTKQKNQKADATGFWGEKVPEVGGHSHYGMPPEA